MHKQIHILRGQEDANFYAEVTEEDGIFAITEGWNCGQITAEIRFPNVTTARYFLAGRWKTPFNTIDLVAMKEDTSIDAMIVKVVHQYWRGIVTEQDMLRQFYVLQDKEESEKKNR